MTLNAPRRIDIEYLRRLLIKELADISRDAAEEERYQRYSAWRDTLTPEEKAAHDLVGKQFTDEMLTYLPLMLGSHLSDNTNRWEEVFQSE